MERERVSSSNLHSVGYDKEAETLEIEFHSGRVYQYIGVPVTIHDGLIRASSKGKFFNDHVKERFRCRRVR